MAVHQRAADIAPLFCCITRQQHHGGDSANPNSNKTQKFHSIIPASVVAYMWRRRADGNRMLAAAVPCYHEPVTETLLLSSLLVACRHWVTMHAS